MNGNELRAYVLIAVIFASLMAVIVITVAREKRNSSKRTYEEELQKMEELESLLIKEREKTKKMRGEIDKMTSIIDELTDPDTPY